MGGISEATEKPESTETETDEWSQNQQKLLELGIKKYGKDVSDRWDKIAEEVVGKDKVWNYKLFGFFTNTLYQKLFEKIIFLKNECWKIVSLLIDEEIGISNGDNDCLKFILETMYDPL